MNSILMQQIGKTVFEQCFAVQAGESILIVTDSGKKQEADLLEELARSYSDMVQRLELLGMTENAQEPPAEVAQALQRASVVLLVTTFSLSHTTARENASKQGARIASLPGITLEMMERTLASDYNEIRERSNRLEKLLTEGSLVELRSPAGTNLKLSIRDRQALADTGSLQEKGSFSNLPAGEAFLAPIEGSTEGTLIIDGSIADIVLDAPVTIEIQGGMATRIRGGTAAQELEAALQSVGKMARSVAELGIGTNPQAIVESDILESEKVLGTSHIAFGNNAHFGGTVDVPFHTDGLVLHPTLLIDGVTVLDQGKLLV